MPELPDVEGYRRVAEQHVSRKTVREVHVGDPAVVRNTTPQGLGRALSGATVLTPRRTGKWVTLPTDAPSDLIVHFGMTGSFQWLGDQEQPGMYDHVRLHVDDGILALRMTRKFGGVWIARSDDERAEITGRLGLDAWSADAGDLRERLGNSRAAVKPALMDQSRVAGVGNLLADEVCWQAMLHPTVPCRDIDDDTWQTLADALRRTLDVGVELGQVPAVEGFLTDVRDDDEPHCPRCGAALETSTIAGRTSMWCPEDQVAP